MADDTQLLGYIRDYLQDNDAQLIDPADLRYVLAAMVQAKASTEDLANFAQLAGAHFSGLVEVPTAPAGTNSQQAASTAFVQAALAAIASGKKLSELVLPQDVAAGNWYLTTDGFWEARRTFSAVAAPIAGPNWRQVASFSGQLTSLSAANITDATDAGRQMLLAPTAAAQRALVNNPRITAGQYGNHPAFNTEDGPTGAWAFVFKALFALSNVQVVAAPAAPTNVEVNDVSKEWLVKVNPAYPSYSQYGITGLPGTVGEVALGANNAYQVSDVLHIKVGSAVAKGNLSLRVIGSGNVPNGVPLVNPDAFTGAATTTPTQPTTTALTAGLAIAVASIMAGNPLTFTVTAGGGAGGYTYSVVATNTATGSSSIIGSVASGTWTPATAGDYELSATVTDSAGASKISPIRSLHVSGAPLANAGSDTVLTQPSSSATLQGSGYEQSYAGQFTYSWSQSAGPVSATFSSRYVAQPTVSGLTAVGDYHFQLIVTDAQGNVSLADEVVVTVQAVASTTDKPLVIYFGTSRYQGYVPAGTQGAAGNHLDQAIDAQLRAIANIPNATYLNFAVSGSTMGPTGHAAYCLDDNWTLGLKQRLASVDLTPGYTRILIVFAHGVNDIAFGNDAETTMGYIRQAHLYAQQWGATNGQTVLTAEVTEAASYYSISNSYATVAQIQTQQTTLNQLKRARWKATDATGLGAHGLFDIVTVNPAFAYTTVANVDHTIYDDDNLHFRLGTVGASGGYYALAAAQVDGVRACAAGNYYGIVTPYAGNANTGAVALTSQALFWQPASLLRATANSSTLTAKGSGEWISTGHSTKSAGTSTASVRGRLRGILRAAQGEYIIGWNDTDSGAGYIDNKYGAHVNATANAVRVFGQYTPYHDGSTSTYLSYVDGDEFVIELQANAVVWYLRGAEIFRNNTALSQALFVDTCIRFAGSFIDGWSLELANSVDTPSPNTLAATYLPGADAYSVTGSQIDTTNGTARATNNAAAGMYGAIGTASRKLPANTTGFVGLSWGDLNVVLGWDTTAEVEGFAGFDLHLFLNRDTAGGSAAHLFYGNAGSPNVVANTGVVVQDGTFYALRRRANMDLNLESTTIGGTDDANWTIVHTYGNFAGDLYLKVDIGGDGTLTSLQGMGLVAV